MLLQVRSEKSTDQKTKRQKVEPCKSQSWQLKMRIFPQCIREIFKNFSIHSLFLFAKCKQACFPPASSLAQHQSHLKAKVYKKNRKISFESIPLQNSVHIQIAQLQAKLYIPSTITFEESCSPKPFGLTKYWLVSGRLT